MADEIAGILMHASIDINVSPAEAFEFWRSMENFPQFMDHVSEVKAVRDHRYRWRVDGPAGIQAVWEADVTDVIPNRRIAWRTTGDDRVKNEGAVTFEPLVEGGTQLKVELLYDPPAGVLGHAVATLFGVNPAQQMREDLQRCKEILEHGSTAEGAKLYEVAQTPSHKPHSTVSFP